MATRVEWTKVTRTAQDFFLSLRMAVGSALTRKYVANRNPRRIQLVTTRNLNAVDLSLLAEMERRRSLAILNNTRNQVR